ncbi:hypothetical protein KY285_005124 [Solanum tuberosum]|uniref:Secreted protein n=1 Tax=Solanum tuberosum TaxID=4113 RepID=M1CJX0_SOLTU|nr:hypothetical protein KY284_005348 [Solanum tuberosum]KAH0751976.1 hypothetical protein KY285_005124 [Solanum tuberosum]
MPGCCCFFAVALWVATVQQLKLLPGGLRRWIGYCEKRERGRGRATEDRREGEEERGERKRYVATSGGLTGAASPEGRRRERAALLFSLGRRRMNCLRVLGSFV